MSDYLRDLFINEVRPALDRHSGSGFVDPNDPTIILVDESGNEMAAVLVDEETVFDATANDIREGKVAVTETGVTVGTKDIPAYHTTEGVRTVMPRKEVTITNVLHCDYTKLQAIVCAYNRSLANSVAAEKVSINSSVYMAGSTDVLSKVTVDIDKKAINLGITNESTTPVVIRFITYKEEM